MRHVVASSLLTALLCLAAAELAHGAGDIRQRIRVEPSVGPVGADRVPEIDAWEASLESSGGQASTLRPGTPRVRVTWRADPTTPPTHWRAGTRPDLRDADWRAVRASVVPPSETGLVPVSGRSGRKTVYLQLKRDLGAGKLGSARFSTIEARTVYYENPLDSLARQIEGYGCRWDMEAEDALVGYVRCPLADLAANLPGLDSLNLRFPPVPPVSFVGELRLDGRIGDSRLDETRRLPPIDIAGGAIRLAPNDLETTRITPEVNGSRLSLHLLFESRGVEVKTGLREPSGGFCDGCLPDLHWNGVRMTLNFEFGGSDSRLDLVRVFASNLRGQWDLQGNPGRELDAALKAVGINGAGALRDAVSAAITRHVQAELNRMLGGMRETLAAALLDPLTGALASAPGRTRIGWQRFNNSIIVEVSP